MAPVAQLTSSDLLTEKNGVGLLARLERVIGERSTSRVDGTSTKVLLSEVELEVGLGSDDFENADGLLDDLRA